MANLEANGFPIVTLRIRDPYELGKQFFQWEFATAIAGFFLGINPFDQPNVESSKKHSRDVVSEYLKTGNLPLESASIVTIRGMKISSESSRARNIREVIFPFIEQNKKKGSYVSIQAYLQNNPQIKRTLQQIRTILRDDFKLATTFGFGPRFLHSTGQLFKGDSGAGLFLQFTLDQGSMKKENQDIPIPDEVGSSNSSLTFGLLSTAEAIGDRRALEEQHRKVLGFTIVGDDIGKSLGFLLDSISTEKSQRSSYSTNIRT